MEEVVLRNNDKYLCSVCWMLDIVLGMLYIGYYLIIIVRQELLLFVFYR